jgi:hypothetical protein
MVYEIEERPSHCSFIPLRVSHPIVDTVGDSESESRADSDKHRVCVTYRDRLAPTSKDPLALLASRNNNKSYLLHPCTRLSTRQKAVAYKTL